MSNFYQQLQQTPKWTRREKIKVGQSQITGLASTYLSIVLHSSVGIMKVAIINILTFHQKIDIVVDWARW